MEEEEEDKEAVEKSRWSELHPIASAWPMNLPNGINGRLLPLGADIHPGCIDNRRHHIKIQMEKKIIITIIIIIIKKGKKNHKHNINKWRREEKRTIKTMKYGLNEPGRK